MTLRILYHAQNKLTHLFGLIFLCFVYFYDSLIAGPIRTFFQISYFTGQLLVNKFLVLWKFTSEGVHLICLFLQVLYEDSLIFVKDATEKCIYVFYLFRYIYLRIEELGWICVREIYGLGQAIQSIFEIFYYFIASLRYGVHFTGSTIWKFLTLIPSTIVLKVEAIIIFITNSFRDLISSVCMFLNKSLNWLEKVYVFVFDIPLDSVYGLIIGAVLATIIYMKFSEICMIISSAAIKCYKQMINFGISLKTGRFLDKRQETNFDNNFEEDERLCVVCQYHFKEIIIFPCKHVCLCLECSLQVVKIHPKCPVCRGKIRKTLKVYL